MNPTFNEWATSRGYNIAPAVLPSADRVYADSRTQEVYEAWCDGRGVDRDTFAEQQLSAAGIV